MANWEGLDKRNIARIPLTKYKDWEDSTELPSTEFISPYNLAEMPPLDPDGQRVKLRRLLSSVFHQKLDGNYEYLETRCDIKRDTFQKVLRANGGRGMSRTMLAKFVVGAGLDESTADELFLCQGTGLDRRSRFDYILMCAIHDKDDIVTFNQDLIKYGCGSILS